MHNTCYTYTYLILIQQQCGTRMAWDGARWLCSLIDLHLSEVHDSIICPLLNIWREGNERRGREWPTLKHCAAWAVMPDQSRHMTWHGVWWHNQRRGEASWHISAFPLQRINALRPALCGRLLWGLLWCIVINTLHCTALHWGRVNLSPWARLMSGTAA